MQKHHDVVQDNKGNISTTATISVYIANSGTLANLFEDDETTALNNPFTSSDSNYDSDGTFWFKANNANYDIKIVDGLTKWKRDVTLFDGDGVPSAYADKAAAAALSLAPGDAGRKIFIASDDGRGNSWTIKYSATPGTYDDDGDSYCGKVFIPAGGDGTIGFERDSSGAVNGNGYGIEGDGANDDSFPFINKSNVFVEDGTYLITTPIGNTNNSRNNSSIQGESSRKTILKQDADEIISYTEKDYTVNKNFYLTYEKIRFSGDGVTASPLVHFGTSDFNIFEKLQWDSGIAGALVIDGDICLATRITDNYFFEFIGYCLEFTVALLTDTQVKGSRVDGSSVANNQFGGILVNTTPNGQTYRPGTASTSLVIEDWRSERLGNWAINLVQSWGVTIRGGEYGSASIFVGHKSSFTRIRDITLLQGQASIIDSGYRTDMSGNIAMDGAGLLPIYNHGYNTIITDADNIGIFGSGTWTLTGAATRAVNFFDGGDKVNSITVNTGGDASQTLALTVDTFYVVRSAFSCIQSAAAVPNGGKATVTEVTGAVLKFDTGTLMDSDLEYGNISNETWGFKSGATANHDVKLVSLNNELMYFHLFDIAINECQTNPTMADAWVGNVPHAAFTAAGTITTSKNTTDTRFQTNGWQIDVPAVVAATTEAAVTLTSLVQGKIYEVSYWVTDLTPSAGYSEILCGIRHIASFLGGHNATKYYDGNSEPMKITFQFQYDNTGPQDITLFRKAAATYPRASSLVIEDFSCIEVT